MGTPLTNAVYARVEDGYNQTKFPKFEIDYYSTPEDKQNYIMENVVNSQKLAIVYYYSRNNHKFEYHTNVNMY